MTTIPGDIPGLLRKWSPVLVTIDSDKQPVRGVVLDPIIDPAEPDLRCLVWNERYGRDNTAAMFVALDLTDDTARWQAARWCNDRREYVTFIEQFMVDAAIQGRHMTPTQIDTLARLVLRLAGRTP